MDHVAEIDDTRDAVRSVWRDQNVVRVEIVVNDLRAQARQKRQRMSFEIVQAALCQCALPLVVDMNEQVARAACMLDVPHQFMAGRRVEETPQCEIEPRRKPAEILSQFEDRRHPMERLSWQKRQHANHARLVAVKNPLRRTCKRRTNPRDRKFRIDLRNMEQGAESESRSQAGSRPDC